VKSATKIGSINSLYTHKHFTEHLMGTFKKSPRKNDLNKNPQAFDPVTQESDRSTHLQQQHSTKIPTQHTRINQTANGVHGQKSNSAGELKTGTGRWVCTNQTNPAAPGLDLAQVLWRGLENSQREDSPQRQDEQKGLGQRDKSTKGSWNRDPARGPAQNWRWKFTHKKLQEAETPPDLTGKQAPTEKIQALRTEIKLLEKFSGKAKNLGWLHCTGWPELICAHSQWPQQLRFTGKKNSRAGKADRRQELKSTWKIWWRPEDQHRKWQDSRRKTCCAD
jgi:hypothetical protein